MPKIVIIFTVKIYKYTGRCKGFSETTVRNFPRDIPSVNATSGVYKGQECQQRRQAAAVISLVEISLLSMTRRLLDAINIFD